MKRKSMNKLAHECADRLGGATWWYHPDLVEAFKQGWRASTANRWPKAKTPARKRRARTSTPSQS